MKNFKEAKKGARIILEEEHIVSIPPEANYTSRAEIVLEKGASGRIVEKEESEIDDRMLVAFTLGAGINLILRVHPANATESTIWDGD